MNTPDAVAIFEMDLRSTASMAIAFVTKSPWTHAAVRIDNVWYDSSEDRGDFGKLDTDLYKNRWAIISEFNSDADMKAWLNILKGKKYNWKGIISFPFFFLRNRNNGFFYCFQTAWSALWWSEYNEMFTPPKVSAESLKYFMTEFKHGNFKYQKGLI